MLSHRDKYRRTPIQDLLQFRVKRPLTPIYWEDGGTTTFSQIYTLMTFASFRLQAISVILVRGNSKWQETFFWLNEARLYIFIVFCSVGHIKKNTKLNSQPVLYLGIRPNPGSPCLYGIISGLCIRWQARYPPSPLINDLTMDYNGYQTIYPRQKS